MSQISVLLKRYLVCYFRVPGHFISDFLLAIIIGGSLSLLSLSRVSGIGSLFAMTFVFLVPFTFMGVTRTMVGEIVMEKTLKLKEFLKLNGVTDLNYQVYCMLVTLFKVLIYCCLITVGVFICALFDGENYFFKSYGPLGLLYLLSGLGTTGYILLISVFFKEAKYAADVSGFLYVVISLCSLTVLLSKENIVYLLVCLFPQCALTFGMMTIVETRFEEKLSLNQIYGMLVLDSIVYTLLYIYLDQIVNDENGVKKHWLFCLSRKPRRMNYVGLSESLIDEDRVDSSSAIYHEKISFESPTQKSVEVKAVCKSFNGVKAVDDISFPMYPGQILSLLGHNGAGKTTTINLLSGLLEIDSGMIFYDGMPFYSFLEEARCKIGLCCQGDILFPNYTVNEHLELIAKLRQIKVPNLQEAVSQAASRLDLTSELTKFSQYLSGGNKRKLSLAMAIIGDTKVVFLDEPTSGMDPHVRRIIWGDIRNLRNYGVTVLMTTHHLDEADELSDRIAIMAKGRLLAMGSSEFIKKSFGAGYYLTVTLKDGEESKFDQVSNKIEKILETHIPGFKRDEQTSSQVMKYLLPFSTQKEFPDLFSELEILPEIRISLQMNSLEDTFVNIGLKEEELFNPSNSNESLTLNVPTPLCMNRAPAYNFWSQFSVMFKRKRLYTFRTGRNVILLILPVLVLIVGFITQQAIDNETLVYFAFFQIIAYSLHTASYCAFPVYEREENLKYALDVMGLRPLPYWLGTLSFDMAAISIINLIQFICYFTLYQTASQDILQYFATPIEILIASIPFSFALITTAYMWSFIFSKSLSAVKYYPILYYLGLNVFTTIIVHSIAMKMRITDDSPLAVFLFGITYAVCPTNIFTIIISPRLVLGNFSIFNTVWGGCFWLLLFGSIYFVITLGLETRRNKFKNEPPLIINEVNQQFPIDYMEIGAESQRTMNSLHDEIKVVGLEKQYKSRIIFNALKGITFGVKPGEIFGLLGPNGAGKSTTFNILTALIPKSKGQVMLFGQEVNRNMPDIYQQVGVCPQFNCLWDVLTVQEHLELFGGLKGYSKQDIADSIRYFSEVLSLGSQLQKRSAYLSGGNKRKLCVANCLIGSPKLMFFDEPSSGLDPLARRFLWNSLQQALKTRQASIVLTTHSMSEAESLAHKTGILINGKFFCIGPTEMLKSKYGTGYKLTILLKEGRSSITDDILMLIPGSKKVNEGFVHQETFQIDAANFKFSEAFTKLELLKQSGTIKDFSIYNTTLEQVFLYFSRFQYPTVEV